MTSRSTSGVLRPPVPQVAQKDSLAPRGRRDGVTLHGVPQFRQQRRQLVKAPMHVADDVERPVFALLVVIQRLPRHRCPGDFLRAVQDEGVAEPLALQTAQGLPQALDVVADDVRPEVPVGPGDVAVLADPLRHVQDDRDRQAVVLPRQRDQRLARLGLDVGRVYDDHLPRRQPLGRDEVQHVKGVFSRRLVVLVVGDKPPAEVRGQHFGRQEMLSGERRLAGAGRADKDDEGEFRDGDVHKVALIGVLVGRPPSAFGRR